ncbi:MAG TPA: D-aminoacylase [Candidatus Aquilonibacter sp.]|nr:D-aminoacylase [Candidatus Aquilonibacter sp.]
MTVCDTLIRGAAVIDGTGGSPIQADVAITGERIAAVGDLQNYASQQEVDAAGKILAPGFIDTHTHDDISVIRSPEMLPKLTQGVTTVIVGNCGICAAPVQLKGNPPEPMNLLGDAGDFRYPTFASYVAAIQQSRPAVNVAALVGHTALRNNHMGSLDRVATAAEIKLMRGQLRESLDNGAIGLSTGLAYSSASSSSTEEVLQLAELLAKAGGVYATHMRTEGQAILQAMDEAFQIGRNSRVPVVISHLKCAGIDNWGRSGEVLRTFDAASLGQDLGCDCYPYDASSTTLSANHVDERVKITITWSTPHPEMGGKTLSEIANLWSVTQTEAAQRLMPAGAIYYIMSEDDMRAVLRHPKTMIGSDGLPNDPRPHPRLWGTFPRVLGYYSREQKLFPLSEAVHKMTGLPARRFGLSDRGLIKENYKADLVVFDAGKVRDAATFENPIQPAEGIDHVWVNGILSCSGGVSCGPKAGRFLARN